MRLLVATDAHIFKTPDGSYWCGAIYNYQFWQRYLDVFQTVRVAARVKKVERIETKWKRVDGAGVEIFEIPFYQGPVELIKKFREIQKKIKNVYDGCDVAIFRMPSPTGQLIWDKKERRRLPVGLEVVYDLTDDLQSPTMPFVGKIIVRIQIYLLRRACLSANGVSYVTERTIQKNFPSRARRSGESKKYFETYYSTITLNETAFGEPRSFTDKNSFTLVISDVAMNSYRKGEKTLFAAMKRLVENGYDIKATIIGDGIKRPEYEQLVKKLGISDRVLFTGLLPSSDEVREYLNKSDIFVFPTEAEGLPRGVLEAMAVGLPVVTSPVGGIPEVLGRNYLAMPSDVDGYVQILERLLNNPKEMHDASVRNIKVARKFDNSILQKKRNDFYSRLARLSKLNRKK